MPTSRPKSREVAEYLKAHPDFFVEHADMLADALAAMNLPESSDASPAHERIHERQVQALRERHDRQQQRLDVLMDTARSNQDLMLELHQIAVTLLHSEEADAQDPVAVGELVKSRFAIDAVAVFLAANKKDIPAQVDYALLSQRVAHLGSVCDDRVSSKLGAALFSEGGEINSCAFVPIVHRREAYGVMVLGAADRERFQPDMGVLFLDRLGQLLGAYFVGHGLNAA